MIDTHFPTEAGLPETVELLHCGITGRIVGIRMASGSVLYVDNMHTGSEVYGGPLRRGESAISYTRTADAARDTADQVDAAHEDGAEAVENARQAMYDELDDEREVSRQYMARNCDLLYALQQIRDAAIRSPAEAVRLAESAIAMDAKRAEARR